MARADIHRLVSAAVAVINAVLAYPVALFLARSTSRWRGLVLLVAFTPLAVGMNMLTIGWLIMLGKNGVINAVLQALGITSGPLPLVYGVGAVVIGLAHISFTFMLLPIESVLRTIDISVERAARSLGARPWKVFLTVTLPLSFEGVAAGMLIVFMQSCGAFVIPLLLGGSSTVMLPVAIWEQMTVASDRAAGAALAVVLAGMALIVLAVQLRYFNSFKQAVSNEGTSSGNRGTRRGSAGCSTFYVALMTMILVFPLAVVALISFDTASYISFPPKGFGMGWYHSILENPTFVLSFVNSLIVAASSTALSLLVGVPAALVITRWEFRGRSCFTGSACRRSPCPGSSTDWRFCSSGVRSDSSCRCLR